MMAQTDEPLSRVDQFVRTNNRLFLAYAGAFGLWQLADLLREHIAGSAQATFRGIALAAWAAWSVLLVVIILRQRTIRREPALQAAVRDERARDVRLRAYRTAFWTVIASAALLGIPAAAQAIPADAATRLVVVVGVMSFIAACVILDRE